MTCRGKTRRKNAKTKGEPTKEIPNKMTGKLQIGDKRKRNTDVRGEEKNSGLRAKLLTTETKQ